MASSRCRLAALRNQSAKPDSSDDLENEVKVGEEASEDVDRVKKEDVVKSVLEELVDLNEKRLTLSLPLSLYNTLVLPLLLLSLFFLLSLSVALLEEKSEDGGSVDLLLMNCCWLSCCCRLCVYFLSVGGFGDVRDKIRRKI
eukprot:scaffold52916_cov58-Attheya_sp.AAC.3